MTRKALARRIAEVRFNEPATRRGAGAAPTRRAARILAGCCVARRLKTTAGILPPIASPARTAAHPANIRSTDNPVACYEVTLPHSRPANRAPQRRNRGRAVRPGPPNRERDRLQAEHPQDSHSSNVRASDDPTIHRCRFALNDWWAGD